MSRTLQEFEERKKGKEREIENERGKTEEGIDDGEEVFPT